MNSFEKPQESFEVDPNSQETRRNQEFLEQARIFGNAYASFVEVLNGSTEALPSLDGLEQEDRERLEKFMDVVQAKKTEQHEKFHAEKMSVGDLLNPVLAYRKTVLSEEELAGCEIKELSPGIFHVFLPVETYDKLGAGDRATAWKPRDSLAFITHPVYQNAEYNARELEENIPHETHHIAWAWAENAGVFGDPRHERQNVQDLEFMAFKDELMARPHSGGSLHGYTYFMRLPEAKQQEWIAEYGQEEIDQMRNEAISTNELLREIQELWASKQTGIALKDASFIIWRSQSFEELCAGFTRLRTLLEKESDKAEPTGDVLNPWGAA